MLNRLTRICLLLSLPWLLTNCGFHLQGAMPLSPTLHRVYIKSPNPYGLLVRNLKDYLKMSHVIITETPDKADVILHIIQESESQRLLSVSSSQQTRQYSLILAVRFDLTRPNGTALISTKNLRETRTTTVQSNDILAGSNQTTLFYEDMEKSVAYEIMNILASEEVTNKLSKKT